MRDFKSAPNSISVKIKKRLERIKTDTTSDLEI
jgi:hypothetical protein